MVDYKALYFKMCAATADAIELLIAAQRECEEAVISDGEAPPGEGIVLLPREQDAWGRTD